MTERGMHTDYAISAAHCSECASEWIVHLDSVGNWWLAYPAYLTNCCWRAHGWVGRSGLKCSTSEGEFRQIS